MRPAANATAIGSRALRRGASRARNAAGGAASRPSAFGSGSAWVASAPISVPRFHRQNRAAPVTQNANRLASGSSRAMAMAVVSSMTSCDANSRRGPLTPRTDESRSPYNALREPSNAAVAAPAQALPPAPMTPMKANWEAPVNMSSDSAQVSSTDSPAVTDRAPNDRAYAPVATAIPSASRRMARREVALS